MDGTVSEAILGAFLTALHMKGETDAELAGAVRAVRERMVPWEPLDPPRAVLDTCGTGGDGARTVNISTATAIVVAACGVPVAKHGNRSATGNSGSSEVLGELGVAVEAPSDVLRRCLLELDLTFLFAPAFHPALRFAAPVRRQLPFRTLFNLVGRWRTRPALISSLSAEQRQGGPLGDALGCLEFAEPGGLRVGWAREVTLPARRRSGWSNRAGCRSSSGPSTNSAWEWSRRKS